MSHSERKNPLFGKPYTQHYDDKGNKIGKSFDKRNPITNRVWEKHTSQNGKKLGESENIKDALTGKVHRQNYDANGNPTSYTQREKGIFGREKLVTRSGKKLTTQDVVMYLILICIAIYIIVKVILPLTFVLLTPLVTLIAIVNFFKTREVKYFRYSLICSALFISDYLLNGYSSYLVQDESFISKNLYLFLAVAFVCLSVNLIGLFYRSMISLLSRMNIVNRFAHYSMALVLGLAIVSPIYFIQDKFKVLEIKKNDSLNRSSQVVNVKSPQNNNDSIIKKEGVLIYTGEDSLFLNEKELFLRLQFVDYSPCGLFTYLIFKKENGDTVIFNDYNNKYELEESSSNWDSDCKWQGNRVKITPSAKDNTEIRTIQKNEYYKVIYIFNKASGKIMEDDSGNEIIDILPSGIKFPRQNIGNSQSNFNTLNKNKKITDNKIVGANSVFPHPTESDEISTVAEKDPEFPGGGQKLISFIEKTLRYPDEAQGKVIVRFVIEKDGHISNAIVDRSNINCPECNKEALNLINKMPKWIPAKNAGKPVRIWWRLPISFEP